MEASNFYYFVLPLWIIVMALVCLVYYYANREERAQKKMTALIRKQEEHYNTETQKLETLRREKTIDQITYQRMKHILETNIEKRREETRQKLSPHEKQEN
jgi:predicted Holliday junction resolvase-like endonuclease